MLFKMKDFDLQTCDWMFERDIVDFRTEDIINFTKNLASHTVERSFEKSKSVFKDWIEDSAGTTIKCLEHDFDKWKVVKIKMSTDDYEEVCKVIEDNFSMIKHIYLYLISVSSYPGISMVDLSRFLTGCNLFDGVNMTPTRLDQLYLNAIKDSDPKKETPKIMNRWNFLELIVRLSKEIYMEKRKEESEHHIAVTRFIKKYFVRTWNSLGIEPWQELRLE
jgi:hypothetical protein